MTSAPRKQNYRFTFGPWNISTGEDPFGPAARKEVAFAAKIREYKKLGFDGVQLHDDDAVEADLDPQATERGAAKTKKLLVKACGEVNTRLSGLKAVRSDKTPHPGMVEYRETMLVNLSKFERDYHKLQERGELASDADIVKRLAELEKLA